MTDYAIPKELADQMDHIEVLKAQAEKEAREQAEMDKKEADLVPVSEEEINQFWDSMLKNEPFILDYEIRSIKFSFRTRTASEIEANVSRMDKMESNLSATLQFYNDEAVLACSLHSFGDTDLSKLSFEKKVDFLRKIPGPIARILAEKLKEFDAKVYRMTEEVLSGNS